MRSMDARSALSILISKSVAATAFAFALLIASVYISSTSAHAQSTRIDVSVCGPSSISILEPVDNATVDTANVTLKGTVALASQIEIYLDGGFNGIIPLANGQSTYEQSISLPSGLHAIKLRAISFCSAANGEAAISVRYTPSQSNTNSNDNAGVGVKTANVNEVDSSYTNIDIGGYVMKPLRDFMRWLNIDDGTQTQGVRNMPLWRAAVAVFGMYLLLFGLHGRTLNWVASWRMFKNFMTALEPSKRLRAIGIIMHCLGLILIFGALFL